MHFKISILSTNCFMAIYEILFNVDSIQALQCEIFSYVYELNLYSVYSWQIIILLELSRHPIELSIKLIVLSILFYILFYQLHGFVKDKSCLTNLLETMDCIISILDSGAPVDVIYLDFSKAFDRVPHFRLLSKLKNLGIKGKLLNVV